jgi:hypothetical protein
MAHRLFLGDNPYVLIIMASEPVLIDLDEPGWVSRYSHLMRKPGQWILGRKAGSTPVLTMIVSDGEQPYYTARIIGLANLPPPDSMGLSQEQAIDLKRQSEIRAYGIGKKRLDGHVDRLWILPNGVICAGDDVDVIGSGLARSNLQALLTAPAEIGVSP